MRLKREFQVDHLVGFVGRRLPFPLPQWFLGRLDEQWVPTLHFHGLNRAIGRNQYVGLYSALDVHRAGQAGILRSHASHNYSRVLGMLLSKKAAGSEHQERERRKCNTVQHKVRLPTQMIREM